MPAWWRCPRRPPERAHGKPLTITPGDLTYPGGNLPSMTGIDIREARPQDVIGLVTSVASLFADDAGSGEHAIDRPPRQRAATDPVLGVADEDRLVLVATDGDRIVGHLTGTVAASAAIRPLRVATLVGMYVFPAHRDAGVGARLVAAFRAWAAERHADRVALDGYAGDASAIRSHRHQRFAPRIPVLQARAQRTGASLIT